MKKGKGGQDSGGQRRRGHFPRGKEEAKSEAREEDQYEGQIQGHTAEELRSETGGAEKGKTCMSQGKKGGGAKRAAVSPIAQMGKESDKIQS